MSWCYPSEKSHRRYLKSRSSRFTQASDTANTRPNFPRKLLVSRDIPKNLCSDHLPASLIDLKETFHLKPRYKVNSHINSLRCQPSVINANKPYISKKSISVDSGGLLFNMRNGDTSLDLGCGDFCCNCKLSTQNLENSSSQFKLNIPSKSSIISTKIDENFTKCRSSYDATSTIKRAHKVNSKPSNKSLASIVEVPKSPSLIALENNSDSLQDIKIFREENYFETHSVQHEPKTAATDHKCKYCFYLNDRLFVKPIHSDNNGNIRCLDCHLPFYLNKRKPDSLNGFIEAKATIKSDPSYKDVTVLLPVTKDLVIDQWRKDKLVIDPNEEILYFGIVNLDYMNKFTSLPPTTDSLALRYQRGFRQFTPDTKYHIDGLRNKEAIIT